MTEFVLNRNHTLRTLFGYVIDFKKGQPTHVPPPCIKDAVAIGAVSVDGIPVDVLDPEEVVPVAISAEERQEKILAAFKMLEEKEGRYDFNAAGAPTEAALKSALGFDIDVEKREIEFLWTAYVAEKGVDNE